MGAARIRELIRGGAAELPLPGRGDTADRWRALRELTRGDIATGRLLEAHADADAILADMTDRRIERTHWWGVWAAEVPGTVLVGRRVGAGWQLDGAKAWCSGAQLCSHALVTADVAIGRQLFAVDLGARGVAAAAPQWHHQGMRETDTRTVTFASVAAEAIGDPGQYLARAGFWHGGIGVAACWFGGALGLVDALERWLHGQTAASEHALSGFGTMAADGFAVEAAFVEAARRIDAEPADAALARELALSVRSVVERFARRTIDLCTRIMGPGPMVTDATVATALVDLQVYIRQHHSDRDEARLARLMLERP